MYYTSHAAGRGGSKYTVLYAVEKRQVSDLETLIQQQAMRHLRKIQMFQELAHRCGVSGNGSVYALRLGMAGQQMYIRQRRVDDLYPV